ncbi:methyl-accepting chemotaxis protein [Azospirillum sp. HJ39]|uniref:methyl-accepting chemotaxis protein n=1 Tax=Azospirillum sp. HJ39 TaxID=3159496 RepID=UPI003558FD52
MLRRLSIATRLGLTALLFLVPTGYGSWLQYRTTQDAIDRARMEAEGAAYLHGIDGVYAALTRSLVLRRPVHTGDLAQALGDLRQRHGGAFPGDPDIAALSLEAEALVRSKDRSAAKVETRRTLRRMVQQIASRSGIILDSELATYALGDIFALRLTDLREQFIELRRMEAAGDAAAGGRPGGQSGGQPGGRSGERRLDAALITGRIETLLVSIEDSLAAATGPQGMPAIRAALDESFQPFGMLVGRALAVMDEPEGVGAGEAAEGEAALMGAALDAIDRFGQSANGHFVALVNERADRLRQEYLRTVAIGGGLSLLALLGVVLLVRVGVIAPLRRMTEALGRLADGDMTVQVPATRFADEIAALAAAMRRFKRALEDSRTLSRAVVESTMQVSVATGQAATAIAQVSDGAHGHMASVERLRHAFLEMQDAMKAVAVVAHTGQEHSRISAERLGESMTDMEAMTAAVREIAGMSSEINRVTATIGKLAAHSNILSLNASIEASRAGEHGRGFSVVAASVGTLAQQTLALAQEIAGLAQRSHDRIARGLEVAAAVGRRMQEVSTAIAENDLLSQTIVDQVAQQRQGVDRIEAALLELVDISQSNASAAEQIAATMHGLAALTDDTRQRAETVMGDPQG